MPNFSLWIALGIIQFVVCQGSIFAIIGTVMAFLASAEWNRGEYESARKKIGTARTLTLVNIGFIILLVMAYVAMIFVGAVAG